MPLKSHETFPPGGFQFFQPQTGWSAPMPMVDQPQSLANKIINHRIANQLHTRYNLSLDPNFVIKEIDIFNCTRLGNDPNWCSSGDAQKKTNQTEESLVVSPSSQSQLGRNLARHVAGLRNIAGGARILSDWLGEGGLPVSQSLAQSRADTCLACPFNTEGRFLGSSITKAIAEAIHEQRRVKTQLDLKVNGEERLHTCAVCSCHLPLKIHVPFQTIIGRTSDEKITEFREKKKDCWMVKEYEEWAQTTSK